MSTGQLPTADRDPAISASEQGAGHTPGPWVANFSMVSGNVRNAIFAGEHGNQILATARDPYGGKNSVAEANARLIAAAPDLFEACREFVRKVDVGEARSTRSYAQMKAALSKATGASS